ncbi:MAG: sigma-70 family RNA polymerase sigma factor [Niastella sp.]|nr:sigma-70 family RNA polymerase sigma factor [Niastella sp.]
MKQVDYQILEDRELLDRYRLHKDNECLGILLQRYTLLLFGVCMKYLKNEEEAKDSVQQIFLKVMQELQKYKVDYFKSWLYMVAKNHCLTLLRHKGRISNELNESILATPDEPHDKNKALQTETNLVLLEQALQSLNKEQKECVTLFYLQKLSYQQVANKTGFSVMQVKSHIQNGKRNLKIQLEKMQHHE